MKKICILYLLNIYVIILPIVDLFKNTEMNVKKSLDFVNNCKNTNTDFDCLFLFTIIFFYKLFMRV